LSTASKERRGFSINGGIEEGDESLYWFEVLKSADIATSEDVRSLQSECDEIVCILMKCRSTAIARVQRNKATKTKKRGSGS